MKNETTAYLDAACAYSAALHKIQLAFCGHNFAEHSPMADAILEIANLGVRDGNQIIQDFEDSIASAADRAALYALENPSMDGR